MDKDSDKPRILVISNGCFSDTDSNGRTLAKLFNCFEPENLAQFYTYGKPDFSVCCNYYQVSDGNALNSFLRRGNRGGVVLPELEGAVVDNTISAAKSGPAKTPSTMLMREMVWCMGSWKNASLDSWLSDFNPTCIIVFASDNTFLLKLSVYVSRKFNIPIVLYTTEDYYFKEYNYITKGKSLSYKCFHSLLKRSYDRFGNSVSLGIFNTEKLTDDYRKCFSFDCETLYAKSDMDLVENSGVPAEGNPMLVTYLGNLGLNRHIALMDIADSLGRILPGTKLEIYGRASEEVEKAFSQNDNVIYRGFVSYGQVRDIMHSSTLLVHAEYNDAFNNRDLKHAFSTKIADSVCCGTPLFLYASKDLAETDFVDKHGCGFVVTEKEALDVELRKALFDETERKNVLLAAEKVRKDIFYSEVDLRDILEKHHII